MQLETPNMQRQLMSSKPYIGRFAPSPSGPLHIGSLSCALASYLDAKKNKGKWLVRIEDIDPPREQKGADQLILNSLQQHGLFWDDDVRYQSTRAANYQAALSSLSTTTYRCDCTRKRLSHTKGCYDGYCRNRDLPEQQPAAIRLNYQYALNHAKINDSATIQFHDIVQGTVAEHFDVTGDFIVHRKDGLFAYQLAVSVDDVDQNITRVVRGCDLLETTPKQILVMHALGASAPEYAHIPVIVSEPGKKLSKQNHAPAIENANAFNNVIKACSALGLYAPKDISTIESLLLWAESKWDILKIQQQKEVLENTLTHNKVL